MNILVVEDEEVVARRLLRLVKKVLGSEITSLVHVPSLGEARRHVADEPVDLVLLDLNLRGEDGFELLAETAAGPYATIVVSAEHGQALRAFEYGVVDFVPKPYDEERLRLALSRVAKPEPSQRAQLKYLAIKKPGEIVTVPLAKVQYISGADDYSEVHCDDGATHLHARTLAALETMLPETFRRVHRSYLVNWERVERYRVQGGGRYSLVLTGGEEIPVSRSKFAEIKGELLGDQGAKS